jgi:hypothetical protein
VEAKRLASDRYDMSLKFKFSDTFDRRVAVNDVT